MKYFSILRPKKNDVRFEYSPWKNVWFCFISIVWFTLVIKLRNFDFKNHWNTLIFLIKKDMASDLNMSYGKMSDFVLFPLLTFTLVIKLKNFDFESHWNIFWSKKWCRIWICPAKQRLIWFKGAFSGLRQFLAIESPLKMMKNPFYFTSKPFLFSRYLNFCLDVLFI